MIATTPRSLPQLIVVDGVLLDGGSIQTIEDVNLSFFLSRSLFTKIPTLIEIATSRNEA